MTQNSQVKSRETPARPATVKRVLNAGAGAPANTRLHAIFEGWQPIRLDIDERLRPDVVGSVTDMKNVIADRTFDAVWSSHNLEHLYAHEVPIALAEFRRVLKPDGFLFVTCPDLQQLAGVLATGDLDKVLYTSQAGPISALDIFFGHGKSIRNGYAAMGHRTGFTAERMGPLLVNAGFSEVWVAPGRAYDLWAIGLLAQTNREHLRAALAKTPQSFLVQGQ